MAKRKMKKSIPPPLISLREGEDPDVKYPNNLGQGPDSGSLIRRILYRLLF